MCVCVCAFQFPGKEISYFNTIAKFGVVRLHILSLHQLSLLIGYSFRLGCQTKKSFKLLMN